MKHAIYLFIGVVLVVSSPLNALAIIGYCLIARSLYKLYFNYLYL